MKQSTWRLISIVFSSCFRSSIFPRKSLESSDAAILLVRVSKFVSLYSGMVLSHDRRRSLTRGRSFSGGLGLAGMSSNLTRCFQSFDHRGQIFLHPPVSIHQCFFRSFAHSINMFVTSQPVFIPSSGQDSMSLLPDNIHCYKGGKRACHENSERR